MKNFLAILMFCAGAMAQQPAASTPAAKPAAPGNKVNLPIAAPGAVVLSPAIYPFPPEEKARVRDYQYEIDHLEIENANMKLKIANNEAREKELWDAIRTIALKFATDKKINLDTNELDPAEVKFRPKQTK